MSDPDKQATRERVWGLLEKRKAARFPGARGRIPNFSGAEVAAAFLADQREWRRAKTVKANPDAPQLPVRARALSDGKVLYMAVPRLRDRRPFLLLDPGRLDEPPRRVASIRGASRVGQAVALAQVRRIDLVVCGSVAVNREGARVGKGGGYSDLEFALLTEAGLVDDGTVIATTVHSLQVLDTGLPESAHDFRVDLIVTPDEVIRPPRSKRRRPAGIIWSDLSDAKIASVPAIAQMPGPRGLLGQ